MRMAGSVEGAQRPFIAAIGHPAAGERNIAAILGIDREELHHLAIRGTVIDREQACIGPLSQRIRDDTAGVVALERRHGIGPRRRAGQHRTHGNQARGLNHSHRRLHFARMYLKAQPWPLKVRRPAESGVIGRCCRVALDLAQPSRHRPRIGSSGGSAMRDLFTSLKRPSLLKRTSIGAGLGILFGLLAFGQAAQAANPLELNFWLSGPRYDGRVAECERALGTITSQFQEKESTFWNSALQITGFGQIQETAFRHWKSGYVHGVEWCVTGLDRNSAYNPNCNAARP